MAIAARASYPSHPLILFIRPMPNSQYFAAIDLGSNSFHMIISRVEQGQLMVVDRVKEMVQIAKDIGSNGDLAEDAQARAFECLACFRERLAQFPHSSVRAVGTKALRSADNSNAFLQQAQSTLGHPIEIVSGYEEARLVYQGVSHSIPQQQGQSLVIDIGGGSTEFIIGHQQTPLLIESLNLGCVVFSQEYMRQGVNQTSMHNAYLAACAELQAIRHNYQQCGWDIAFGTSGTMKAVAEYLPGNNATIDKQQVENLYQEMINHGVREDLGIPKPRRDVLPAGVAIIKAIFDQLQLRTLNIADAALKEGLIYDMIGRLNKQDTRNSTVKILQQRYQVDTEQASLVFHTALQLLQQLPLVEERHILISPQQMLGWAAKLHEIGLGIAHAGYHQHGHYLLRHSDIAGFSRLEQHWLAQLVRLQRKKIPTTLANNLPNNMTTCVACLRLAVLLCRSRQAPSTQAKVRLQGEDLHITVDGLENQPLTHKNLLIEKEYIHQLGLNLIVN